LPERPKRLARWRRGRWRPRKRPAIVLVPVMTVALIVIMVVTAFALVAFFAGRPGGLDNRCEAAAASCGVLSGLLLTLVPIAIAVVWLIVWRLDRVRRAYRREAQRHAIDKQFCTFDQTAFTARIL
jgi:uncharacterized membrane protein YidH (DUF202 family)